MSRLNIAMLSEEVVQGEPDLSLEELQSQVLSSERRIREITGRQDIVAQAHDDLELLDAVARSAETAAQAGQAEDAAACSIAVSAIEGIRARSGLSSERVSLETRSGGVGMQQVALEARALHEELQGKLHLAQEGLMSELKFEITDLITTNEGLIQQMHAASKHYDSQGAKPADHTLHGVFSRYFKGKDSGSLTGSDALECVSELVELTGSDHLLDAVTELTELMRTVTASIRKNWIISDDETVYEIITCRKKGEELHRQISSRFVHHGHTGDDVHIAPLQPKEKRRFVERLEALINTNRLNAAIVHYNKAAMKYAAFAVANSYLRLGGLASLSVLGPAAIVVGNTTAGDLRNGQKAAIQLGQAASLVAMIMQTKNRVALASVQYLSKSSN